MEHNKPQTAKKTISRVAKLKVAYENFCESIFMDIAYEQSVGSKLHRRILFVQYFAIAIWWVMKYLCCKAFGHKLVDDSHAGPESGDMSHHCTRCGCGWHVQLY